MIDFDRKERLSFHRQEVNDKLTMLADLRTEQQVEDIWGNDYSLDADQIGADLEAELDGIESELDQE